MAQKEIGIFALIIRYRSRASVQSLDHPFRDAIHVLSIGRRGFKDDAIVGKELPKEMVVISACAIIALKPLNLECWVLSADVCHHFPKGLCTNFGILLRKKINKGPACTIVKKRR